MTRQSQHPSNSLPDADTLSVDGASPTTRRVARRELLLFGVGAAAASSVSAIAAPHAGGALAATDWLRDSLGLALARPEHAREIGLRLTELGEAPGDVEHIKQALQTNIKSASQLRERLAQDYADGAVVFIDGWMMSETEARICALVARWRV